jgi:hypothetical protein
MSKSKWAIPHEEDEFPVSEENAEKAVIDLLTFYRVDVDDIEDDKMKKAVESALNKLQAAYRRGQLENSRKDGTFKVIQTTASKTKIEYDELKGEAKTVMDGFGENANYQKQYALLGSLSGLGAKAIQSLNAVDVSVAECLGLIFLMV